MKYIRYYLIPAYYDLLNGNVTVQGIDLPVYDAEAIAATTSDLTGSYILLGECTTTQALGKGVFNSEVFQVVDVVIKSDGFLQEDCDDAVNQITQLINSDENPDCTPDFQIVTTSVQSINNFNNINKTENVFRTIIRFRHIVKQL